MSQPKLTLVNGKPLAIGNQLGTGGEGAVYSLHNDTDHVVKVYHKPLTREHAEKLMGMVALTNQRLTAVAAWPSALVYETSSRQVAGFVMPRLNNYQEIWRLYHPIERLKYFPRAGWTFQIRAAQNLAAAFDEVHQTGCVIGDVQLKNAHVAPNALVRLVDCDSFQVCLNGRQYFCDVGLPHYIPPELQGKQLRGLLRTDNHDRFGLAVLIYQLLFVGRHPYMGVYLGKGDPSFDQLIADYRFAQGPSAASRGMSPPPHTPTFLDIPQDLGMLFCRAFERGSERGTRPKPSEWVSALARLERASVECEADSGHKYWSGARGCVWCRLAERGGPEYYYGVSENASSFVVDEDKLRDVEGRLRQAGRMNFAYDRTRFAPKAAPEPEPLPEELDEHRQLITVLQVTVVLCILALPIGFIRSVFAGIAFAALCVLGVWLLVLRLQSPIRKEHRRRKIERKLALMHLDETESGWDKEVAYYEKARRSIKQSAQDLIAICRTLNVTYQDSLRKLSTSAEEMARLRFLRLHLIADADIPNVGVGRKQVLAVNHIITADDVDYHKIRGISGFGDTLARSIVSWRHEVLRKFQFDPRAGVSPADHRQLTIKFRARQKQILAELEKMLAKLASLEARCRNELSLLEPSIREALADWEIADANYSLVRRR